jgi:hypothetical protein
MKILRIRRGFTTNSSASTEWVPPPNAAGPNPLSGQASQTTPSSQGAGHAAGNGQLATNGLTIGGIVLAIVSIFLAERVIRLVVRKRKRSATDEQGDADE